MRSTRVKRSGIGFSCPWARLDTSVCDFRLCANVVGRSGLISS